MPIDICLTVDTEFDIAGAFSNPNHNKPIGADHVFCPVEGKSEGLGFILQTLNHYDQQATFFVETMNTSYFGDKEMGEIVEQLLRHKQDVQLHLHPCWKQFENDNWRQNVFGKTPNDDCAAFNVDALSQMIESGLSTMNRWGASNAVALRTGNLSADHNVYQAMAYNKLTLASNIGAGYALPSSEDLRLYSGRHFIENVMEIPVLSYVAFEGFGYRKTGMISITGCSNREIEELLWQAVDMNISPVVLITHPAEFVKKIEQNSVLKRNKINQKRLQNLCKFIADNDREFKMTSFGENGVEWLRQGAQPSQNFSVSRTNFVKKSIENKLNDLIAFM